MVSPYVQNKTWYFLAKQIQNATLGSIKEMQLWAHYAEKFNAHKWLCNLVSNLNFKSWYTNVAVWHAISEWNGQANNTLLSLLLSLSAFLLIKCTWIFITCIQQCSNIGLLFRPPWMEAEVSKSAESREQNKAVLNKQRKHYCF